MVNDQGVYAYRNVGAWRVEMLQDGSFICRSFFKRKQNVRVAVMWNATKFDRRLPKRVCSAIRGVQRFLEVKHEDRNLSMYAM